MNKKPTFNRKDLAILKEKVLEKIKKQYPEGRHDVFYSIGTKEFNFEDQFLKLETSDRTINIVEFEKIILFVDTKYYGIGLKISSYKDKKK